MSVRSHRWPTNDSRLGSESKGHLADVIHHACKVVVENSSTIENTAEGKIFAVSIGKSWPERAELTFASIRMRRIYCARLQSTPAAP